MKSTTLCWVFLLSSVQGQDNHFHAGLLIDGLRFCTGSLIAENFVITSADCVKGAFEIDVALGTEWLLKPATNAFISTNFTIDPDNLLALIKIPPVSGYEMLQCSDESSEEKDLLLSGFNMDHWTLQEVENVVIHDGKILHVTSEERIPVNVGSAVHTRKNVLVGVVLKVRNVTAEAANVSCFLDWILRIVNT